MYELGVKVKNLFFDEADKVFLVLERIDTNEIDYIDMKPITFFFFIWNWVSCAALQAVIIHFRFFYFKVYSIKVKDISVQSAESEK